MKLLKYMIAGLLLGTVSCAEDETNDSVLAGQREALLAETDMGIYVNGSAALRFDKKTHQASVAPSTYRFRIMDDAGMQYVEIVLGGMPQESKAVSGELTSVGFKLSDKKMQDVVLLKQDGERLWLWSDATHTGMILPWCEL